MKRFSQKDPDKMTQVFDNVITNAMKYSRGDKRVEFHVKQNALYNRMTIRIKDNGIGIPINKVDKIFHRFYRVDKARTSKWVVRVLDWLFQKKLSKHIMVVSGQTVLKDKAHRYLLHFHVK